MAYADNLMSSTQNFMTPDFVNKFSSAIGQPADKIQAGLRSIIPAFLLGLANKGSSSSGADTILNLTQSQTVDGESAVNNIFGGNLNSVSTTLGETTGLGASSVKKIMSIMAPTVLSVVGSKIRNEKLNTTGIQNFFSQQKSMLSGLLPGMKSSYVVTKSQTGVIDRMGAKRGPIAFLIFLLVGAGYWMIARESTMDINSPQTSETIERPFNTSIITEPSQSAVTAATTTYAAATEVGGLGKFLNLGAKAEIPKRFSFQNLNFETATATLGKSSELELNQIAEAMKQYPNVTARIEGFTDNSGSMTKNLALSQARANSVREALIKKGIAAERLEAVGRGEESPLAENNSPENMAMNRRIEFIVTGK